MESPIRTSSRTVSRRRLIGQSSALAGVGLMAGFGGRRGAASRFQTQGGKVTWALDADPIHLVPYLAPSGSQMQGKEFIYDSLLAWDRDLNVVPALAESYTTPDELTYVFVLRQGVKFHNGKEMDAEDVKYSIDLFMKPPDPNPANTFVRIASTEVVDKYTVKVTTSAPDPTIPGYLAWSRQTAIIPIGTNEAIDLNTQAIGTGPFKLVEFVPGDRVVLERNPDFWRPGLPYIDELTLRVLADEQLRLAALRSGDIDGATLTRDIARTLEGDQSLSILSGLTSSPRVIQFTIRGDNPKPWHDVRVRQAVNAAINRQTFIDNIYGGAAVLTGPIPPGYGDWFIPPDELASTFYKHDVAAAQQLMTDAGVDGFEVILQSISAPREYTQIAEIIKEQLEPLGIDVTVQPLEIGTFAQNVGTAQYEWASTGRGMRGDPSGFVNDFRPQTAEGYDPASMFYEGWYSAELDELYNQGLVLTDPAARKPIYRRIQEIILTEVPNMYTVQPEKFQVIRSRLKNMYVSFTDFNTGLREAWIEE